MFSVNKLNAIDTLPWKIFRKDNKNDLKTYLQTDDSFILSSGRQESNR